jgi:Rha family phage regulatory protein
MSIKPIKNELGIFIKNNIPVVSSRVVAKRFGKEHYNVLRDINNLDCSAGFRALNFEGTEYRDKQNKNRPEYLMTKDGFTFLIMGFTGKEAAEFREKYIAAFNHMTESLQNRNSLKISYWPMMEAVKEAHKDPKFFHYTNEINMIYRIVLGVDAKKYREKMGLVEDIDLRDHITNDQQKMVDKLQQANTGLIIFGVEYNERKEKLKELFLKLENQLQNNSLLC